MKKWWKRLVACSTVASLLMLLLTPLQTATAAATVQDIGKPTLAHALALGTAIRQLGQKTETLVRLATEPGGLFGWKEQISPLRDRLVTEYPLAVQELQAVEQYAQTKKLPAVAQERADDALHETQEHLAAVLDQLATLLHLRADSDQVVAQLKQLNVVLGQWQHPTSQPTNSTAVLPFGPSSTSAATITPLPLPPSSAEHYAPVASGAALPDDTANLMAHPLRAGLDPTPQSAEEILRWSYENLHLQWYGGSAKHLATTMAERAGNDVDISSLTIGLLRDIGVSARWGHGVVSLSAQDWNALTGLQDGQQAARFLSAAGIAVTARASADGKIVRLDVPHTWVEAQLQPGQWTALDVGWKPIVHASTPAALDARTFDLSRYLSGGQGLSPLAFWEGARRPLPSSGGPQTLPSSGPIDDVLPLPETSAAQALSDRVLPLMHLPLTDGGHAYSSMPADWIIMVHFAVGGLQAQVPMAELADKRLTLLFAPATQDDKQLAWMWGGMAAVPTYLQRVRPALYLDGKLLAADNSGTAMRLGESTQLQSSAWLGGVREEFSRPVTAGTTVGITIQPQPVADQVTRARIRAGDDTKWTSAEALLGSRLRELGLGYLERVDRATALASLRSGMPIAPGFRGVLTIFDFSVTYLGSIPLGVTFRGLALDAARVTNTPISPTGDAQAERVLSVLLGAQESFAEGEVFRFFYGKPGASTNSLLHQRTASGARLKYLCTCRPGESATALSPGAEKAITDAVNQGYMAVAPSTQVNGHDVYILLDPKTGASGYSFDGMNGAAELQGSEDDSGGGSAESTVDAESVGGSGDGISGIDGKKLDFADILKSNEEIWASRYHHAKRMIEGYYKGLIAGFVFSLQSDIQFVQTVINAGSGAAAVLLNGDGDPSVIIERIDQSVKAVGAFLDDPNGVQDAVNHAMIGLEALAQHAAGDGISIDDLSYFVPAFMIGFAVGMVLEVVIMIVATDGVTTALVLPLLADTAEMFSSFMRIATGRLDEWGAYVTQHLAHGAGQVREAGLSALHNLSLKERKELARGLAIRFEVATRELGPEAQVREAMAEEFYDTMRKYAKDDPLYMSPEQEVALRQTKIDIQQNWKIKDEPADVQQLIRELTIEKRSGARSPDPKFTVNDFTNIRVQPPEILAPAEKSLLRRFVEALWALGGDEVIKAARTSALLGFVDDPANKLNLWGFLTNSPYIKACRTLRCIFDGVMLPYPSNWTEKELGLITIRAPRPPDSVFFAEPRRWPFPNNPNGLVFGERLVVERELSQVVELADGCIIDAYLLDGQHVFVGTVRGQGEGRWLELTDEGKALVERLRQLQTSK